MYGRKYFMYINVKESKGLGWNGIAAKCQIQKLFNPTIFYNSPFDWKE